MIKRAKQTAGELSFLNGNEATQPKLFVDRLCIHTERPQSYTVSPGEIDVSFNILSYVFPQCIDDQKTNRSRLIERHELPSLSSRVLLDTFSLNA